MTAPALSRPTRIRPVPPVNVLVGVDPVHCRPVRDAAGLAAHHRIRHAVFVEEQSLFTGTDEDAHDARTDVVHVLALHAGRPAGTVRLYPVGPGEWLGDRLAVLPEFRTANIGAPLVRFAVAAAGARGGRLMRAHVQQANERFFHRLGWRTDGPVETYVGHPHVPMCVEPIALCPWLAGTTPR
ncbi:MSMEG_0567/Sll0786 family nitrogen starvation N-acetyltransferase [Pseudonocardia xinjiangensis]|uniref:MSMEG_0567/Sll0786 family nitrogen starvation N-acetyltransferase n=1 Tax=Pseudonocardia xinjiangensis TaxID=75289 RepID=UPI003D947742